ncbi:phosphatidylinositol 4-phosphate 5-kinase type-1 alpha-like isoform X2 [Amphibalanus amphitrite]|uniref:phosphatidylinositol 4-phosphate 5-kinase type-1 alpha-like isoform X2 n=1 Tax=Amphibalanus amphitrite TaxID=1232801 RepID=UPI001C8FC5BD|nr:phosphatidylinositol 4-phosphate 5-kinase type-1 alpha-like isoform X2 [Amphibalanus amphitrite]
MKGKHEKELVRLDDDEILELIGSRLGLEATEGEAAAATGTAESTTTSALDPQLSRSAGGHGGRRNRRRSTLKKVIKKRPKKNIVTPDQYDWANRLIPSFQLGIDVALTQTATQEIRDLLFHDFFFIEIIQFNPSVLNRVTSGIESFTLKAYAPMAFAHFRKLFNVRDDVMRASLCEEKLTMVVNAGASGSIFYVTPDRDFVLKTVTKKEAQFLQELLPEYYMNIHQNPSTFLPRFYGLFVVKRYTCVMRLVIMNNIIRPGLVDHKFDLKGSRYHRCYRADGAGAGTVGTSVPTLKDLDFIEVYPNGLLLEPDVYSIVSKTLQRDVLVLQSFDIMDYSLLLAIRKDMTSDLVASTTQTTQRRSRAVTAEESYCEIHMRHNCHAPNCCSRRLIRKLAEITLPCGGIPAFEENGDRLVIYMGIIDILQDYGIKKIAEHFMKSLCIHSADISEVSVQPPDFYAVRFSDFITHRVFRKGPEQPAVSVPVPARPASAKAESGPSQTPPPAAADPRASLDAEMATSLYPAGSEEPAPLPEVEASGSVVVTHPPGLYQDPAAVTSSVGDGSAAAAADSGAKRSSWFFL